MFGGDNNINTIPLVSAFIEDNRLCHDTIANVLPQLRYFRGSCCIDLENGMANKHTTPTDQPHHRSLEMEGNLIQQTHGRSLIDYLCQYKAGQPGSSLNPNHVLSGLRLSSQDQEHNNSSVTSASENLKAVHPMISSVGNDLKIEIARQNEEFEHYLRLQQEKILNGVTELRQRQTVSFLNALKNGVSHKLHQKEMELATMNRKNDELMAKIKQITTEVHSWHYKAKYNESVVNFLRNNLQHIVAQGAAATHREEGCGDSEVDAAASCTNTNRPGLVSPLGEHCRACKAKKVSALLLPCRHLCLCRDCEGFVDICPVCNAVKTASVQVNLS